MKIKYQSLIKAIAYMQIGAVANLASLWVEGSINESNGSILFSASIHATAAMLLMLVSGRTNRVEEWK